MMIDFTQEISQIFKFRKRVWVRLWNVNHLTFWFLNVFYLNQEFQDHFGDFEGWKKNPPKPSKPVCIVKIIAGDLSSQKTMKRTRRPLGGEECKGMLETKGWWCISLNELLNIDNIRLIINVWQIFKKSKHMLDTGNINTHMQRDGKGSFWILKRSLDQYAVFLHYN